MYDYDRRRPTASELVSKEFSSPEALKNYLKEHPKADKSKHTVKKPGEAKPNGGDSEESPGAHSEESPGAHLKRLEKIKKLHPELLREKTDGGETGEEHLKRLRKIKRLHPELLREANDFDSSITLRVAARYIECIGVPSSESLDPARPD